MRHSSGQKVQILAWLSFPKACRAPSRAFSGLRGAEQESESVPASQRVSRARRANIIIHRAKSENRHCRVGVFRERDQESESSSTRASEHQSERKTQVELKESRTNISWGSFKLESQGSSTQSWRDRKAREALNLQVSYSRALIGALQVNPSSLSWLNLWEILMEAHESSDRLEMLRVSSVETVCLDSARPSV